MPKNENKNGKNLLKVLKTLDYSPVARYINNVGCIFSSYSVGCEINFNTIADKDYDNISDLNGDLSLYTYNNNNVSIPLKGKLNYCHTTSSTGLEVDNVDLTNIKAFVFSSKVSDDKGFELLKYGLYDLFNNNNNNGDEPFYPTVTLAAGPLLLKNAQYISGNENIACFIAPNYKVYLIPSDAVVYLSEDPSTQMTNYKNELKAKQ